jgi:DNA-binding MarR family transcriptional regulator
MEWVEAAPGGAEARDLCPPAADMELLKCWGELHAGFRRLNGVLLDDVEAQAEVAPSTFQALWFLMSSPDFTAKMSQLSQTLGFSTAGTTKVADRMAEAGLITRTPSTADRRVILVTLTAEGARVSARAIEAFLGALRERVVRPLGEEGFAQLAEAVAGLDPHGAERQCPGAGPAAGNGTVCGP